MQLDFDALSLVVDKSTGTCRCRASEAFYMDVFFFVHSGIKEALTTDVFKIGDPIITHLNDVFGNDEILRAASYFSQSLTIEIGNGEHSISDQVDLLVRLARLAIKEQADSLALKSANYACEQALDRHNYLVELIRERGASIGFN